MPIKYATELGDVMQALDPRQLQLNELSQYFIETEEARDPHLARREMLYKYLRSEENVKVLVIGHGGTGKSTELVKLQEEHGDEYAFISCSPVEEMIMSEISIEAILILVIEGLVRKVKQQHNVELPDENLKPIYEWFSQVFEIKENDLQYGLEAGIGADTKGTWWGKLLGVGGFLKADLRAGSRTLRKVVEEKNRRISELAEQCNLLIAEVKLSIREKLHKDLVLIVEDLDKISLQDANDIFLLNPAPLAYLRCKAVYTLPISLLCNPLSTILEPLFKKVTIPMIKTCEKDLSECSEGCETLKHILAKRMDPALIEPGALLLAIKQTGGVIRHLFEVVTIAAAAARHAVKKGRAQGNIIAEDVRYGLNREKDELVKKISVIGMPKEFQDITTDELFERLEKLAQAPRKLESDKINQLLLQSHAVIEYNGEGWHCVHPLVTEYLNTRK